MPAVSAAHTRDSCARQQTFQEIEIRVEAVHDQGALGMAGKEAGVRAERGIEHGIVGLRKTGLAGGIGQIEPRHRGFQLVATGGAGPAQRVALDGLHRRQRQDGVETIAGAEIAQHVAADGGGGFEEFGFASGPPDGQQAADDDAAIEEVSVGGPGKLEGHRAGGGIPGRAGEEARGGEGAVQVDGVSGEGIQPAQRGGGIAGDFGRDRRMTRQVGAVITGHAAIGFLDAGAEKPLAGMGDLGKQLASVASAFSAQLSAISRASGFAGFDNL